MFNDVLHIQMLQFAFNYLYDFVITFVICIL